MESHGKLNHYKKIISLSLLCIMIDNNFTECILLKYEQLVMEKTEKVLEKVLENHVIFCNSKSMNPAGYPPSTEK